MKQSVPRNLNLFAIASAFLGVTVLVIGIAISASAYSQLHAEPYSLANHFISELGWERRSPMAEWFNWSLAIFCVFSMPLIVALGARLHTAFGYIGTSFGVCMLLSGFSVAIFPVDSLNAHMVSATVLFWAYFFAMTTFTAAFLFHKGQARSFLMVVAGLVCLGVAATFLSLPKDSMGRALQNVQEFQRPRVWWLAIFEWGILILGVFWGALAAVELFRKTSVSVLPATRPNAHDSIK